MVADELLKARNRKSEASIDSAKLIRNLIDTIAVLGNDNSLLNLRRRDAVRPVLSQNFAPRCSSQVPCTKPMFRDDLAQSCKSIQDSNRIGSKVQVRRSDSVSKTSYSHNLPCSSGDWRYTPSFGRGGYNRRMRVPYYRRGRRSVTRPFSPYPLQSQLRPGNSDSSGTNKQSIRTS